MIIVRIGRRPGGTIAWFKASGHSGYASRGKDIICAGVSAITLTAVLGLGEYLRFPVETDVDEDSGLLACRLGAKAEKDPRAQAILETMVLGLQEMAKEYGSYLRIEESDAEEV